MEEGDLYALTTGFGLFTFDWNLNAFADKGVVKSWESSADHMMDKVVMRDDLTWSDGRPLTAHDIVFSYETIVNPQVPVPAVHWAPTRFGPSSRTTITRSSTSTRIGLERVEFELSGDSQAHFREVVARGSHAREEPLPPTTGRKPRDGRALHDFAHVRRAKRSSSNAAKATTCTRGSRFRDKPYFKTVRLTVVQDPNVALLALKKGDLDELQIMPEQWMTQTTDDDFYRRNTKARGVEWLYFYFGYNMKTPFFSDVRVRKAMSYAMDHDEMLTKLSYGLYEPSNGIFHHTAWMYPKDAAHGLQARFG